MQISCVEVIDRFTANQTAAGKAEMTVRTYRHALVAFSEWLTEAGGNLAELTRHDVQSYVRSLEAAGKSASTIGKIYAAVCVFARFTGRPEAVENIRIPQQRKVREIAPGSLERKDRNRLLREVERDSDLRNIALTYTLLLSGLRVSELCALDRSDVVIGERSGSLSVTNGKGGVDRVIPLAPEARHHLSRYLNERTDSDPALFLSNYRQRISVRTVQHTLKKYGVHPHELRHTFCRELVGAGVDIAAVAELAGHADINVTRRYSKPSQRELESAIDRAFS